MAPTPEVRVVQYRAGVGVAQIHCLGREIEPDRGVAQVVGSGVLVLACIFADAYVIPITPAPQRVICHNHASVGTACGHLRDSVAGA